MSDMKYKVVTSNSTSGKGDAGKTGSWRVERPIIDMGKCTPAKKGKMVCHLCWLYCPDAVVTKEIEPKIDLEYCKGCGICAEECPTKAIKMVEERELAEKGEK
ncbi:MAG: 4Fe-4S binding protein [Proteobacteria bacterium]|nr:4Fe-4S binding protein [Pseudomonadota bacterium]